MTRRAFLLALALPACAPSLLADGRRPPKKPPPEPPPPMRPPPKPKKPGSERTAER